MIDNPWLEMIEMSAVTTGVGYLLSTIKNPESKKKYQPMLLATADEIYLSCGIVPPPRQTSPTPG